MSVHNHHAGDCDRDGALQRVVGHTLRLQWAAVCVMVLVLLCSSQTALGQRPMRVAVTTTIIGDVVREVGGEHVDLRVLMPHGADPHMFEPSPRDMVAAAEADVVFVNGAGLERFLPVLMQSAPRVVVSLSEGLTLRRLHHDTGEEGEDDPHVWLDPLNVIHWVDRILLALVAIDPDRSAYYADRAEQYKRQLHHLDVWIRAELSVLPHEHRILVTDHDSFGYFAARYGFVVVATVIPGFSTLAEPSAREMAALHDLIRQRNARAIFTDSTTSPALIRRTARDLGLPVVVLRAASLDAPGRGADSYIKLMQHNVRAIVSALKD